jgi:hypothetical protein
MSTSQPYIYLLPTSNSAVELSSYVKPSEKTREWFAPSFYHCLPLVAANTLGWTIYNLYEFTVRWDGQVGQTNLQVNTAADAWPVSWFGYGVFTILPRFFAQTSPDVNLLIKPVPNVYKRGVLPLEGLVETDWLKASFSLNFKVTEPDVDITYRVGEPLAQLVPVPRNFVEQFDAQIKTAGPVYDDFMAQAAQWIEKRRQDIQTFSGKRDFSYMRGENNVGQPFPAHQKSIRTPPFKS